MRFILLATFLYASNVCFAQQDMPDFRSKRDFFTRIMEKDIRADLSSFTMAGIDESVGKLNLKTVPIKASGLDFMTFEEGKIKVTISTAKFDVSKHKLGMYDSKYLIKIDNKPYFGDYGKVPKTYVKSVQVIIDKDTIMVPAAACNDLCNPILTYAERGFEKSNNRVYLSVDSRKIYVYMLKQEEGGSYEATWVIQDKKYLKRVVDFGFLK